MTVANEGYVLNTVTQTLKGNHGFDNSLTSMRSIFMGIQSFINIYLQKNFENFEDQPLKRNSL